MMSSDAMSAQRATQPTVTGSVTPVAPSSQSIATVATNQPDTTQSDRSTASRICNFLEWLERAWPDLVMTAFRATFGAGLVVGLFRSLCQDLSSLEMGDNFHRKIAATPAQPTPLNWLISILVFEVILCFWEWQLRRSLPDQTNEAASIPFAGNESQAPSPTPASGAGISDKGPTK
jgi:hypothetical protein